VDQVVSKPFPAGADSRPRDVPAHQLAVARAVTRSHASIPAAFTVVKVPADSLLRQQEAISRETACFIGVTEFVIKAIALTAPAFPASLASVGDGLRITPAGPPDIGVTIDVGTGLYVPVIRAAATEGLTAISRRMMYLRTRAMRGRLSEDDLAGARITLTLHQVPGIVLARPIIYPGQTCAFSLTAPCPELSLGPSGQVTESVYVHLGLSYDHRALSGREAAGFLTAIRDRLQDPRASLGL
jgi:2-oxoglutarate dehydrogenase E2 component (dihydrolipoamide succinyltransferase)